MTLFIVDAFADGPFGGNPAAVCYTPVSTYSPEQMQLIASEMNLSETAFCFPIGDDQFSLRWFTPTCEVPLCGHATLATSHVLFNELGVVKGSEASFATQSSGMLICKQVGGNLQMDFPKGKPASVTLEDDLIGSLCTALGSSSMHVEAVFHCPQTRKLLVRTTNVETVVSLSPDFGSLLALQFPEALDVRGVIVTAKGGDGEHIDFTSRYFAPWNGIDEDPVTGSAHTVLGVYWSNVLNKSSLVGFQRSKRGGQLILQVGGDDRILISGRATTVLSGNLRVTGN